MLPLFTLGATYETLSIILGMCFAVYRDTAIPTFWDFVLLSVALSLLIDYSGLTSIVGYCR